MAKSGEGDPRWIIEDRNDYVNVNNWHWIERDVTAWSVEKIQSILLKTEIKTPDVLWNVSHATCEGMSTINVRKGVLKYIVDLELSLDIDGLMKGEDNKIKGKITIPEFCFDNASDIAYEISIDANSEIRSKLANELKEACPFIIGSKLKEFLQVLVQECSKGLIIPQNEMDILQKEEKKSISQPTKTKSSENKEKSERFVPKNISKKLLTLEHEFSCSVSDLFGIFTSDQKIFALTNSATVLKPIVNESYSFLSGNVKGKFFEINKDSKLVMSWRFNDWPSDYYSLVTLIFTSTSSGARICLSHEDVPENDIDRVKTGWERYFFLPIVRVFGYGSESLTSQFL